MNQDLLDSLIARELPAAQRGDREAYTRLVAATQRMVASVALAVTRDLPASEDIAQETFLAAWQRLPLMRNPASFLPWLRQVARHRAIDHVRAQRWREQPAESLDALLGRAAAARPGPSEMLSQAQDAAVLAQALDDVPEQSREVLLLFYREGESSRAVAALLGLSDAAVRKRLQRAREALREQWLRRVGDAAANSAPGLAFTSLVSAALALRPELAGASTLGAGALLKFSPKMLLGVLGAAVASVAVAVGAVMLELRLTLRRATDPAQRRALLHNGIVYAALMGTYMVVLSWTAFNGWGPFEILAVGAAFSLAVVALAWRRSRLLGERRCARRGVPGTEVQ